MSLAKAGRTHHAEAIMGDFPPLSTTHSPVKREHSFKESPLHVTHGRFNLASVIRFGLLAMILTPTAVYACACGCGVFDVGTSMLMPTGQGFTTFLANDYQNQNRNWHGTSPAPAANNDDKDIETYFLTLGLQDMFNGRWGAQIEVPYDYRRWRGVDDAGDVVSRAWSQPGDIRLEAIYAGCFEDMSAGLTLGLKLPTGGYKYDSALVDRDTQIGTGSTDILLGGFYHGNLDSDYNLGWFAQAKFDLPVLTQGGYRPGSELDSVAGIIYQGVSLGSVRISPLAQMMFSERTIDAGPNAARPVASGYQRLMLSPGVEVSINQVHFHLDAEFPVYQNFNGDQLAAPVLLKFVISYAF